MLISNINLKNPAFFFSAKLSSYEHFLFLSFAELWNCRLVNGRIIKKENVEIISVVPEKKNNKKVYRRMHEIFQLVRASSDVCFIKISV